MHKITIGVRLKVIQLYKRNERQKHHVSELVERHFKGCLSGIRCAVWGLSFKPQTDDARESPALTVIRDLTAKGAHIRAYDPQTFDQAKLYLKDIAPDRVEYIDDMYTVLEGCDPLILLTGWKQFCLPDFALMKAKLAKPLIFDGRNQYDPDRMQELGFC